MKRRTTATVVMLAACVAACSDETSGGSDAGSVGDAGQGDLGSTAASLTHTFPPLVLEPFAEVGAGVDGPCQSWTLGNEEPIWVNRVVAHNDGGWHHSNWFVAEEGDISAPDGTFKCSDEGIVAPLGQIFFAQTTQSTSDEQAFGEGVAFELPPHAVVVGQMHMLNIGEEPLETGFRFEVFTIPADEVKIPLRSSTVSMQTLNLPPGEETLETMTCPLPASLQGADLHYVLPHYHAMGRRLFIETTYEDGTTATLFEGQGYGEAAGQVLEDRPKLGRSLTLGCDYTNTRDEPIGWGFMGADEMCVALLYTTGTARLIGTDVLGSCVFLPM